MKNFFLNRVVLAIFAFIVGGVSVWGVMRHGENKKLSSKEEAAPSQFSFRNDPDRFFNSFFNDDFFGKSRDPFEEMRRMQRQIGEQFGEGDQFQGSFDNWYKKRFGGGDAEEIKQREDSDFVYYEIDLHGQKPEEVKVDVKDGQVFISGQSESKKETGSSTELNSSSFQRSFPVPPDVDADNLKMQQEGEKIVIQFPKKKP